MVELSSESGVSASRPLVIGPDSGPAHPFPLRLGGKVVSGFGRGSKELGIPTANIPVPDKEANHWINTAESGVYFGWAGIRLSPSHPDFPANSDAPLKPSTKILDSSFIPPKCAADIGQEKREEGWGIWPMVMSIGYNPFYKNEVRSAEVHVLHGFGADFYGCEMRLSLVGFIRKELDYKSLEALVEDIKIDCEVAGRSLRRDNWGPSEGEAKWLVGDGNIEG